MYDYHLLQQALSKKTNENLIVVGSGMTHVSDIVEDYNQLAAVTQSYANSLITLISVKRFKQENVI